ncbi:hypothetical protein ILYODFUR_037450 [Ilyodon furcidens]|uniref:Uncharacterized protein n=1 Tax=Ilyodon furcidens TaxID=33524 RepID=A0ABV0TQ32_9TELE
MKCQNQPVEQRSHTSRKSWSPNFRGGTGVRTRSKYKKTTPSIYPGEALMAHEQKFHPSGKNLEEDTFPLVEVANPNVGDANHRQPPTILVYRPWTQEDRTAALKGIPPIQEGVEEFLAAITELRGSFHLNGREMLQCFTQLFGHRWCRVAGGFTGCDDNGDTLAHDSPDLRDALRFERIRGVYIQTADYGKISQCKQKDQIMLGIN